MIVHKHSWGNGLGCLVVLLVVSATGMAVARASPDENLQPQISSEETSGGEQAGKSGAGIFGDTHLAWWVSAAAALFVAIWTVRQWRYTIYIEGWSNLIQFLYDKPQYMDPGKTWCYQKSFTGDDAIKYELVARLCIAYLDDVYFVGGKRMVNSWLKGSVKLLCGRHRQWMEDNKGSYDKRFYDFIMKELDS